MKKLMLSTRALRAYCLAGDALMLALCAALLAVSFSWLWLLAALTLLAMLGAYTVLVFRTAAFPDREGRRLCLTGLQSRTDDLTDARVVYTRPAQMGQLSTRAIVIEDGAGRELSVIMTLVTARQGDPCERLAQALAEELDIPFRPTVPLWRYDRKAKRERLRAQKEARKNPGAAEAPPAVNYDEQDDEP